MLHTGLWVLLFFLPYLLRPSHDEGSSRNTARDTGFFYQYIVNFLTWIAIFYFHSYYLIPSYLNKKRYKLYILILIPLMVIMFGINWLNFKIFLPGFHFSFRGFISFYFLPLLFILSVSMAITLFQNKLKADQLAQSRENANLKTELAFLRSQISPHFMFNVLNNMVALARKKSDLLEPSLFKLSSLLRYMLYETDEDEVQLSKEIEYLNNYIDLQLQRFGSKVSLVSNLEKTDSKLLIAPMLLIPFVENAFKHGTGLKEKGEINIELHSQAHKIEFIVTNRFDNRGNETKDKDSGIGLQNVKRRLDLLYPERHSLQMRNQNNYFTVILRLNLK
ncbi:hypothetical protein BH20BAC1_BH20BAC1_16410 [soil metagenome]